MTVVDLVEGGSDGLIDDTRVADLLALVARYDLAQREEDVAGWVGLFHEDAVWVTAGGVRLVGRQAIGATTARLLPGSTREASATYRATRIVLVTPEVAHLSLHQEYRRPDGGAFEPPREGLPSLTCLRTRDGWRIVAGQNTPVPAP